MLAAARRWNDFTELPEELRRYLGAIALLGPMVALALFAFDSVSLDLDEVVFARVLTLLAIAAERYPLHLTNKTNVNMSAAVYLAMLLLLPWHYPALIALFAAATAHTLRLRSAPSPGIAEPLFNIGQTSLYVAAGAISVATLQSISSLSMGQDRLQIATLIVASSVMHLTNTGLVSIAAGLQLDVSPIRIWVQNIALDFSQHLTLTILGGMAAKLAQISPFLLPAFVLPGVLVHRATMQTSRLQADARDALVALVELIELRDPYTAGHSRRVAASARLLAFKLGLTAEKAEMIESAGHVHDIGKIAIDPLILIKASSLSSPEWAQMKLHPSHGACVIERFAAYDELAEIVRHHHEAWDGTGYPEGIAGESIPLGSRILAVADTFDALTSDRPYRSGKSPADARAILAAGAGSQWDPRVVRAFLELLDTKIPEVPLYRPGELSVTAHGAAA